jgi:NitT/TauT family transport system substrate-binding protein
MANPAALSRSGALALLGAATLAPRIARAQPAPKKLRICGFPADSYSEPYYAIDQGFLAKVGIDLEVIHLNSAGDIANAVNANAIDIGMDDAIEVANPFLAGMQIAFFGTSGLYSSSAPTSALVVAQQSPITSAKDLEGKIVAIITLASLSAISMREWLRVNGADQSKVKLVELPFGTMVPAIQRGTIDACLLAEPFLSLSRGQVRSIAKPQDTIAKSFVTSAFFAQRAWIEANRATARAFMQAMYETARWANTHQSESAVILSKYSKLPLDQVQQMTRVIYTTGFQPALMQPVLDVGLRYNEIKRGVNIGEIVVNV